MQHINCFYLTFKSFVFGFTLFSFRSSNDFRKIRTYVMNWIGNNYLIGPYYNARFHIIVLLAFDYFCLNHWVLCPLYNLQYSQRSFHINAIESPCLILTYQISKRMQFSFSFDLVCILFFSMSNIQFFASFFKIQLFRGPK